MIATGDGGHIDAKANDNRFRQALDNGTDVLADAEMEDEPENELELENKKEQKKSLDDDYEMEM
jgi:hypothetical protein